MNNENLVVEFVDIGLLNTSELNPETRTRYVHLTDLLDSMKQRGFLANHPISVTKDYVIGDGHRRVACAKRLNIETVPVIVCDNTVEELMSQNAGAKPWRLGDWPDSVEHPKSVRDFEESLLFMAGSNAVNIVRGYKKSPRIGYTLKRLLSYVGIIDDVAFGEKALIWLCAFGMQNHVTGAMKDLTDPSIILDAINNEKPLMRGNWYA